ncbi:MULTISPECIES: retropepsin-like aspartic protease [unclassified Anabaena]|uniref:retropepsin-like aspartic protease family protein n=1 Tax=unclassified Anabaena TaxID=2619674 RepID=UPI002B20F71B|nr:retropepsin-like aspartic protease [Anabaena sp. UHCC 0399]MEA5565884.1 retropepsin-like aspartic protease [Anabaena sp. UHCC 0399]
MINASKLIITNINLALITLLPTLMFLALPHRVNAEDPGECFMINASGRTIKLEKLCGVNIEKKISPQAEKRVFRVPIKRRLGRTPVIDVTFNNNKTFEMIFDTGANNTLITIGTANALQLKTTGVMTAQIADGSQIEFPISTVQSMAAGGAGVQNVEVAIAHNAPIGLLGNDFFGHYDIKILETTVEFHPR